MSNPSCNAALLAVKLGSRLRSTKGWWFHQPFVSPIRVEDGSVPALIPSSEAVAFAALSTEVNAWFKRVAADSPPQCSQLPPDFASDQTGILLEFLSDDRPSTVVPTWTTDRNRLLIWRTLVLEIACGYVEVVLRSEVRAAGLLFLGPKDRPCYHPVEVNDMTVPRSVYYPRASDLLVSSEVSCATKGDVKSAFRHLPLSSTLRPYFGMLVDNVALRWARLPFGLRQAPAAFCSTLRNVLKDIPKSIDSPISPTDYVDDLAQPGFSPLSTLRSSFDLVRYLYYQGGFLPAVSKWYLHPATALVFTGVLVDFSTRTVRIQKSRAAKALSWISSASHGAKHLSPISIASRRDLESFLGMIAWFAMVLPVLSLSRRSLDVAFHSKLWSQQALNEVEWFVQLLPLVHAYAVPLFPESPTLFVVTDASASGWGAFFHNETGSVVHIAGKLSEQECAMGSMPREIFVVLKALEAAHARDILFRSVAVDMDAQSAVAAMSRWSTRSVDALPAMKSLAALVVQGMHFRFTWRPRSTPTLVVADALSAAVVRSAEWHLSHRYASALWAATGGWDLDLFATETNRLASDYAALRCPDGARAQVLTALPLCSGYLGDAASVSIENRSVFAFPPWSSIPLVVSRFAAASSARLTLVIKYDQRAWLWSCLRDILHWRVSTFRLDIEAARGPLLIAPDGSTPRLPYRLVAFYYVKSSASSNGHPRPTWWTPEELLRDGDVESNPGMFRAKKTVFPLMACSISLARSSRSVSAPPRRAGDAPTTSSSAQCFDALFIRAGRRARSAEALSLTRSVNDPDVRFPIQLQPAIPAHPVAKAEPPVLTLGTWLTELQQILAGTAAPSGAPTVPMGQTSKAMETRARVRLLSVTEQNVRARAVAFRMFTLASSSKCLQDPYSVEAMDALCAEYVYARLKVPMQGWRAVDATTLPGEMSALAAAARRAGRVAPPHMGALTWATLDFYGAFEKREHSNKFPIHIADMLRWRERARVKGNPLSDADLLCWRSLVFQAFYTLRPGIVPMVTRASLTPWKGGYLLSWSMRTKTKRGDRSLAAKDATIKAPQMSAARHRLLSALMEDLPAKGLLFPGLTSSAVNAFIKREVGPMPNGFVPGAHGARVAADTEALELGAPQKLLDIMGWWKQEKRRMSDYYSGTNVQRMFALTELYGFISFEHLAPGFYDLIDPPIGTVRPRFQEPASLETRPSDWQKNLPDLSKPFSCLLVDADSDDDELPAHATRCSNVRSRIAAIIRTDGVSQHARSLPSPELISSDSESTDHSGSTFSTDCARCEDHISRHAKGALCDVSECKWTLCSVCHPDLTKALRCPEHRLKSKRRRPNATKR